ncbi:MAG: DUF4340 domain-containing protein [Verrucomicrobia bacterium]|nr:DUF4340 domain-containing protein [Verrucomicrobiota bacterium]
MRARTTLFLFLLVAALAAVILGIERYLPTTRELAEMKKGPIRFDPSKITQIEIESSGGDSVSLANDGAQWWVRSPFNDLADPEKVTKLLNELTAIGWINRVHRSEFDDAGWAKTLLDKPHHTVKLNIGSETILVASLAASSPIEGSHYLSLKTAEKAEETAHYVAKTTLPDLLKATPQDWRDSKLLRLPADAILNVKLVQAGGQIELNRSSEKAPWMLVKPLSTRASNERVGELLSTLINLTLQEAAEPTTSTKPTAATADTTKNITGQELKVSVLVKGLTQSFDLTLTRSAKDAPDTSVMTSYRKPIFKVLSKSINDLWLEPNDLRDLMLARIDTEAVTSVDISSALHQPIHLEKKNQSWFIQRHQRLQAANGDRISRFFEALNTFEIYEFTSDSASNLTEYGLDKPFLTASWTEGKEKPVKLHFGTNKASTDFFAKYDHEPSVYRIDASILPNIPQEAIKWKGLGVLRFTQFSLRQISLTAGTAPATILKYDPSTAQWKGERANQDITQQIDRVKADKLSNAMARFSVQDWSGDPTTAITALQSPALRVVITLGEPGTNTGPTRDTILNFAPTQTGLDTTLYFGQVQGDPDVFYIARSTLLQILAPVFKTAP